MILYVVATPVGHLEDMTRRAARVLAECDMILCEDTRRTRRLVDALGITTPLRPYHDHTTSGARARIVEELVGGATIALVSDAGTPCISDPGFALVRAAREAGASVVPVPGPSALTAFLSAAGLPTDRFQFVGFAPRKRGARERSIDEWLAYPGTTVAFESPQRVVELLASIAEAAPDREVALGRELTKRFEEFVVGRADEVRDRLSRRDDVRGEFVVGLHGAVSSTTFEAGEADAWIQTLIDAGLGTKAIAQVLSARLGGRADQHYRRALELSG